MMRNERADHKEDFPCPVHYSVVPIRLACSQGRIISPDHFDHTQLGRRFFR